MGLPSLPFAYHPPFRLNDRTAPYSISSYERREIGTTIQRDFEFPGTIVTVIEVEVTDDLKEARVWVGVVGRMAPSQVLEKLNSRHGLIQSAVAKRVVLRNTPRLSFRLDDSAQRGVDLVNLLDDIDKNLPKAPPADPEDNTPDTGNQGFPYPLKAEKNLSVKNRILSPRTPEP